MTTTDAGNTEIDWKHGEVIVNGVRLHFVEAGEGPLVLLLHGFPDFWRSWRFQIPALVAAGFHVVAPDMRGYGLSEKPPGVQAYHIDNLVADTVTLLHHFGGEEGGFLVGHDWGGVVAWYTATQQPEVVRKLVILNAPHPSRYLQVMKRTQDQRTRGAYVGFFQLPWLPERWLTIAGGRLVEQTVRRSGVRPAAFPPEEGRMLREAITRPGAATATLNYYRSLARRTLRRSMKESKAQVHVPTLLLWGVNDVALHIANADPNALRRWVPDLQVEKLDASHWAHWDVPGVVNTKMLVFLTTHSSD